VLVLPLLLRYGRVLHPLYLFFQHHILLIIVGHISGNLSIKADINALLLDGLMDRVVLILRQIILVNIPIDWSPLMRCSK